MAGASLKQPLKLFILASLGLAATAGAMASVPPAIDFHDHLGLQLWSLRVQMKTAGPDALDLAKDYGFTEVETAGTAGMSAEKFREELDARGLKVVGAHVNYDVARKDFAAAIRDAKTLGATYLIIPWLPHDNGFTAEDARRIAAEFNGYGQACAAAGLRFGYHTHGYEFMKPPVGGELAFDVLARETKPELVCFEMDVFWVIHGGGDPLALLAKYPARWVLMHVKDMKKGAVKGFGTAKADPSDRVTVGEGEIDWPAILTAARRTAIGHYFIEDETPSPLRCIPDSLAYLRELRLP